MQAFPPAQVAHSGSHTTSECSSPVARQQQGEAAKGLEGLWQPPPVPHHAAGTKGDLNALLSYHGWSTLLLKTCLCRVSYSALVLR